MFGICNQLIFSNSDNELSYNIKKNKNKRTFDYNTEQLIEKRWALLKKTYEEIKRPLWNGNIYSLEKITYYNGKINFNIGLTDFKEVSCLDVCWNGEKGYVTSKGMGVQIIIESSDSKLIFGKRAFENDNVALICGVLSPEGTEKYEDIFLGQSLVEIEEELGITAVNIIKINVVGFMKTYKGTYDIIVYCKLGINYKEVTSMHKRFGNNENSSLIHCENNEQNLLRFIDYHMMGLETKSIVSWILYKAILLSGRENSLEETYKSNVFI